MSKTLRNIIIIFFIFLIFSVSVLFAVKIKEKNEEKNITDEKIDNSVIIDIEKLASNGIWYDITEEDKITLAFSGETEVISTTKQYLKDNKIAILFVYGGPFDYKMEGNYVICTGFNEDGKAKILYPDDEFSKEWRYSFEGLIEFATKVMLFEM